MVRLRSNVEEAGYSAGRDFAYNVDKQALATKYGPVKPGDEEAVIETIISEHRWSVPVSDAALDSWETYGELMLRGTYNPEFEMDCWSATSLDFMEPIMEEFVAAFEDGADDELRDNLIDYLEWEYDE
jgi:hypothetical protein